MLLLPLILNPHYDVAYMHPKEHNESDVYYFWRNSLGHLVNYPTYRSVYQPKLLFFLCKQSYPCCGLLPSSILSGR
ncbi:hypothetical protein L596_018192 [Steinernema carpocapsae]|uniref:Uncharacterized protein n=1 Tax=Steinernema carpocapsae TaxID=34508 RepID=A0A4U5N4M7_STECR|nr:hypothetical protein L596_018192 [Steinernema carpocapsae]